MDITNTKPYLGRCKEKGCNYALFATPDQVEWCEDWKGVTKGGAPKRVGNNGVFARCSNGHKVFQLRQIKGTYSEDHKCDARCLNAKGHECTCSCGGLNHGRGYAVEIVHHHETTAAVEPVEHEIKMITEPQARFLRSLLDEREIPAKDDQTGEQRRASAARLLDARSFTLAQASKTIAWLKELPRKEVV